MRAGSAFAVVVVAVVACGGSTTNETGSITPAATGGAAPSASGGTSGAGASGGPAKGGGGAKAGGPPTGGFAGAAAGAAGFTACGNGEPCAGDSQCTTSGVYPISCKPDCTEAVYCHCTHGAFACAPSGYDDTCDPWQCTAKGGAGGGGAGGDSGGACGGTFPTFDNACAVESDCAFGVHQTDCCGNTVALGLAQSALASFQSSETAWDKCFPQCGCPTGGTQADDGMTTFDVSQIGTMCVAGHCKTYVMTGAGGSAGSGGASCDLPPPPEKACTADGDCTIAYHELDCCGSLAALGIVQSNLATYAAAEQTYDACLGICNCPPAPTTAEDGSTAANGPISVACKSGLCETFLAPQTICQTGWPTFDESCTSSADCAWGWHQTDCCGSQVATSVNIAAASEFKNDEKAWEACQPTCQCAAKPPQTEDGMTVTDPSLVVVTCNAANKCETTLK